MLIKSCTAHLCHLPGFDQVGHSPLGNQWGVAIWGRVRGVSGWLNLSTSSDCFKWGLIDDIDQQRVHSLHWQFQMGGGREGYSIWGNIIWKFELISGFTLASQSSFVSIYRNERPISTHNSIFYSISKNRQANLYTIQHDLHLSPLPISAVILYLFLFLYFGDVSFTRAAGNII